MSSRSCARSASRRASSRRRCSRRPGCSGAAGGLAAVPIGAGWRLCGARDQSARVRLEHGFRRRHPARSSTGMALAVGAALLAGVSVAARGPDRARRRAARGMMLRARRLIWSSLPMVACSGPPADRAGSPFGLRDLARGFVSSAIAANGILAASAAPNVGFPRTTGDRSFGASGGISPATARAGGLRTTDSSSRSFASRCRPRRLRAIGLGGESGLDGALRDDGPPRAFHAAPSASPRGVARARGADAEPLRIWVKDWSPKGSADARSRRSRGPEARRSEMRSRARFDSRRNRRSRQGDRGTRREGAGAGKCLVYYSFPRSRRRGSMQLDGNRSSARQRMDRSGVGQERTERRRGGMGLVRVAAIGWARADVYRLRNKRGSATPFSGGSIVERDGVKDASTPTTSGSRRSTSRRSARTGVRYPVRGARGAVRENLTLEIEPYSKIRR